MSERTPFRFENKKRKLSPFENKKRKLSPTCLQYMVCVFLYVWLVGCFAVVFLLLQYAQIVVFFVVVF